MKGIKKTNALRLLDAAGIDYECFEYDPAVTDGQTVALLLGEDPREVFKTLVTADGKGGHFVFVIPVGEKLDLRRAARAAGVKNLEMLPQKELLPLTGYVHSGCSPVGMKKKFPVFLDRSAPALPRIYVSAGRVGCQMRVGTAALAAFAQAASADLTEYSSDQ